MSSKFFICLFCILLKKFSHLNKAVNDCIDFIKCRRVLLQKKKENKVKKKKARKYCTAASSVGSSSRSSLDHLKNLSNINCFN